MMMFIDRQMQLPPSAPRRDRVLFLVPFIFAVDLQSSAVDDDHTAEFHRFGHQNCGELNCAFGDAAKVWDGNGRAQDSRNGGHEPLSLALASRYSDLVADARLRKKIFTAIEAEWHSTAHALATITGDKNRLANNAALQRSIRYRFPYIDPLHHLQVELVRRYRAGQADERVQRGIHISINGIAAGLRNTG